ncbi:MAG TPA: metallophosphoesterase [Anaerovoracaceae bacterium]|nr:metallophosphoesterase [Anaerovoracaceae bacterium]
MKILALSDTHDKMARPLEVINRIKDVDLIIHCGDYYQDAIEISKEIGIEMVAVKGNCDGSYSSDDFKIVETPYGKILVTHGHMDNVSMTLQNLHYKAQENGCKVVVFGHTHKAYFEEVDGVYMINPGSLTMPRDGSGGTCAVFHALEDDFYGSILYYDVLTEDPKKKKVQGGYLRGLLNYSDRF